MDYREKFIEAEGQAEQLVDLLQDLKQEMENYQTASDSLDQTKDQLDDMFQKFDNLVLTQRDLISAIEEIGPQEIIDAVESSNDRVTKALDSTEHKIEEIKNYLEKKLLARITKKYDEGHLALQNRIDQKVGAVQEDYQEYQQEVVSQNENILGLMDEINNLMQEKTKQLRLYQYITIGLVFVLGVIGIILSI
jgi:DNA repair exonuclease SbcCD ATPase subunit